MCGVGRGEGLTYPYPPTRCGCETDGRLWLTCCCCVSTFGASASERESRASPSLSHSEPRRGQHRRRARKTGETDTRAQCQHFELECYPHAAPMQSAAGSHFWPLASSCLVFLPLEFPRYGCSVLIHASHTAQPSTADTQREVVMHKPFHTPSFWIDARLTRIPVLTWCCKDPPGTRRDRIAAPFRLL